MIKEESQSNQKGIQCLITGIREFSKICNQNVARSLIYNKIPGRKYKTVIKY